MTILSRMRASWPWMSFVIVDGWWTGRGRGISEKGRTAAELEDKLQARL